ncbi:MAG: hypothetical protein WC668_01685 [Patescibacteria group bacterium]|jgi:hypothetical protein
MPETTKRGTELPSPGIVDLDGLNQAEKTRESRQGGDLSDREAELTNIANDIEPTIREQAARKELDKDAPLKEWLNRTFGKGGLK